MKSLEKSGLMRVGAYEIASLIALKLSLPSAIHLNATFFFNIIVIGLTRATNFGTNLRTKLILPKKL